MRFFIDTAKVEDIKKANDMGVICGVTTNPSLEQVSISLKPMMGSFAMLSWLVNQDQN